MFELRPFVRNNRNELSYNPFREMEDLERNFFNDFPTFSGFGGLDTFRTDITDKGGEYLLETDLPGFKKEDIKLDLNGDTLTVHAERHSEHEDKSEKCLRRERSYGSYTRSFDISEVDAEGIKAKYSDGVLSLILPKKTETLPAARQLQIE